MQNRIRKQQRARFEQTCRSHGLPVTIQRRAVFEAIVDHDDHPTADQVYHQVRARIPGLSRMTVYRILTRFVELGLVVRICHHGSAARFDPKVDRHHHLVCSYCETIIDFEDEALNTIRLPDVRRHGFKIEDYHIHFRGVCSRCRSRLKKGRGSTRKMGKQTTRKSLDRNSAHPFRKRRRP